MSDVETFSSVWDAVADTPAQAANALFARCPGEHRNRPRPAGASGTRGGLGVPAQAGAYSRNDP